MAVSGIVLSRESTDSSPLARRKRHVAAPNGAARRCESWPRGKHHRPLPPRAALKLRGRARPAGRRCPHAGRSHRRRPRDRGDRLSGDGVSGRRVGEGDGKSERARPHSFTRPGTSANSHPDSRESGGHSRDGGVGSNAQGSLLLGYACATGRHPRGDGGTGIAVHGIFGDISGAPLVDQ
jgi:hypothetical protein